MKISSNYQTVIEVGPGYLVVHLEDTNLKIIGNIEGIKAGDIISFTGVFQEDGTIKLINYYVAKHRWLKYAVSVLAVFLVFLCLWANFKIDWKAFILVEKRPCQTS